MMRICSAQMYLRTERPKRWNRLAGSTLAELVVVIVVVGMFVLLAHVHLFGLLRRNTFRAQLEEFVSAMRMAATSAAETGRRYEVIIDPIEQGFILREITSPDLSQVLEEEIIIENYFGRNCHVAYVEFDDGTYTNDFRAKFRAGLSGWQYGGKVVLMDEDERAYSVVVNRLNRMVVLKEGDVLLMQPRPKDEMLF
ncbi:MAG: hypothetical protein JSU94_22065 [Phycisphaerales bacterium]|nr:MAG: hypothetical protein JSU94_22065 [Phycisphaerales bacterium]